MQTSNSKGKMDEIDKAALKAIKATNLCMKHMKYHGQKYKDCTPQERVLVQLQKAKKRNLLEDK